ncbi:Ig-like domain-containing protein [Flavisolibacter tropicus]|uniref:Secretion system C-terminal sorting domain-containing protein n=1 Tax=Flavisolibacter tropicus TaxID=1492898 RepID=A0A172TQB4_9BACT|nr:cadherin-like domain-containing protein [Flavisolibacter tropicus]ANE49172.1 hypothetical protein SY85_00290 [Flavisolibacter tropicus]
MKPFLMLTAAAALLCTKPTLAQSYTETFEGGVVPGCATLITSYTTTLASDIINGTGSLYSNPPVNNSGTRDYLSPYLNVTATSLTISFWYKLNEELNGNAKRSIEIGLEGSNGVYRSLNTLTIDKNTLNQTTKQFQSVSVTAPSSGIYRLVLKMGGSQGNGTVRIIVDDITINAAAYYSSVCNLAPIAVNDNYVPIGLTPFSNNVITNTVGGSDNEPNGESMKAVLITAPVTTEGTVVLNVDGTFTFTPSPTFSGGPVTFTYQLSDNGYTPATSNIATVTINYPAVIVLPVILKSFEVSVQNSATLLKWVVSANETGDHFQVFRSSNGKSFSELGTISASKTIGEEVYTFTDPTTLNGTSYYKIKTVSKDNRVSYSNVLIITSEGNRNNQLLIAKNPVESVLHFSYTSSVTNSFNVSIYTSTGVKMLERKMFIQKGTNAHSIELNNILPAGTYILEINNGVERQVVKLLKK